jgi:hypothetical protein
MEENMKRLMLFLFLSLLTGCAIFQQTAENNIAPQLLMQYPLPALTQPSYRPNLKIEMDLYIMEDGSVGKVNLIKGSGDNDWDSLAIKSIFNWKYSPAHVDHHFVKIWLHQEALVQSKYPEYLVLTEILCPTLDNANSIYTALQNGKNFDELSALKSVLLDKDTASNLGKVDIHLYPEYIFSELSYLEKEQFTKPLKYGDKYVIFIRK